MKKTLVLPIMAIMVLAFTGTAMAYGGCPKGFNRGNCVTPFEQLTPEKQLLVKKIINKYDSQLQSIRTKIWAKRTELQALIDCGKAEKKTLQL